MKEHGQEVPNGVSCKSTLEKISMTINWSKTPLTLRPTSEEETRRMQEFAGLWKQTSLLGEKLGWKVSPGSIVQLYFQHNPNSMALEIFVSPSTRNRFLFRVTPVDGALHSLSSALAAAVVQIPCSANVAVAKIPRAGGSVDVVEVRSTWEDVIGHDEPSETSVAERLHAFVAPLLQAIPGGISGRSQEDTAPRLLSRPSPSSLGDITPISDGACNPRLLGDVHSEPSAVEAAAKRLSCAYRDTLRPFLEANSTTGLEVFDNAEASIYAALKRPDHLVVGFIGEAQVGKSSLINALLDTQALPAGGVGPLTARATRVAFGPVNTLAVIYHTKKELHRLLFVVETQLARQGKISANVDAIEPPDDLDLVPLPPDEESAEDDRSEAPASSTERVDYILAQARKLVLGSADPSLADAAETPDAVVLEALRLALGYKVRCEPALLEPHIERIRSISEILGSCAQFVSSEESPTRFGDQLWLHAAGWVAPLVGGLDVVLNAALTRSLTLVDLPGIGVVGDPAANEARKFVSNEGDALVLVFRNNGVTEALATMLEQTGVITRMLFEGGDGARPIHLVVAVTYLDTVARAEQQRLALAAQRTREKVRSLDDIFAEKAEQMRSTIRSQLVVTLKQSSSFKDLSDEVRERREKVVERLCAEITIECVAAPDYTSLDLGMESAIKSKEATRVPAFRGHLEQLATRSKASRDAAIEAATGVLRGLIDDQLGALEATWEGGGAAQRAWETFRPALEAEAATLRREMDAHHVILLETLDKVIPLHITALARDGRDAAGKRLRSLCAKAAEGHWKSVEAALRNDGQWDRRDLNFPQSITSAFVDTIAALWEPRIVELLRAAMKTVAERDLKLVERLCAEATKHDDRIADEAHIEAQKKLMQQRSRACIAFTRERLEDLQQNVKGELFDEVLEPIALACTTARRARANQGTGARNKMLTYLARGGEEAAERAARRAEKVLRKHYDRLVKELKEGYLDRHQDPVGDALLALLNEETQRVQRSDAQKRKRVLSSVEELRQLLGFDQGNPQAES